MKIDLFLRLFTRDNSLPCASALVSVDKTPNSVSYANIDLKPLTYVVNEQAEETIEWQKVGDAIFTACSGYQSQSVGRIWVGGKYEITWRKV